MILSSQIWLQAIMRVNYNILCKPAEFLSMEWKKTCCPVSSLKEYYEKPSKYKIKHNLCLLKMKYLVSHDIKQLKIINKHPIF